MAKRSNPAVRIAQETAHNAVFDAEGKPKPGVHNVLLRAVEIQRPLVLAYVRRLQRKHPQRHRGQLAAILERDYLRAVTGGGAIVGATAVVPGVGTVASLGLSAAATVGFLEATALYATSLAELHGIRLTNPEKASTMVMAIMLGEEGTALLGTLSGQAMGKGPAPPRHGATCSTKSMPLAGFGAIRTKIQKAFLKNLLKRQGTALPWPGPAVRHRRRGGRCRQPDHGPGRGGERQGGFRSDAGYDSGGARKPPHPAAPRRTTAGNNTDNKTLEGNNLGS